MRYDVVSFDLDGTLVDSADEIAEAANRALEEQASRPGPNCHPFLNTFASPEFDTRVV